MFPTEIKIIHFTIGLRRYNQKSEIPALRLILLPMIEHSFSLIPFPAPNLPAVSLTGTVSLKNHILTLHYSLTGNIAEILLPPASPQPSRRDELWKATCFEFFLAVKDQSAYWEFNMSPSGDWNVYRMDAYRRIGFRTEREFPQLTFETKRERNEFSLDISVDLTPILQPEEEGELGITAILQTKDGYETYWALAHPGSQADFHLRESFILPLAIQTPLSGRAAPGG
jgi:hypothetical protein